MKRMELNLGNPKRLQQVARALGSEIRIRILELLDENSMNIVELAQRLNVPVSTVSNNVVVLEEADLIRTERQAGVHGMMKLCSIKNNSVDMLLFKPRSRELQSFFYPMPIGHYTDCQVVPVCGLLDMRGGIGVQDDARCFYDAERHNAQLLWFQRGYVEYRFSNQVLRDHRLQCLEVSFEACSEAPNYRLDWPSDITVWINDVELGTWCCPGDYGGRQGHYSPDWWPLASTQYGILKRWRVDENGSALDDCPLSEVTLRQLRLEDKPYISLRIGIKKDSQHQGGINLFGDHFGDYNQAIVMRMDCLKEHEWKGAQQYEGSTTHGAPQT